MVMLVSERNVDQILLEFKEYSTEVDIDFVRKSVRAIGRCAIKLERAAKLCVTVLLELIQTKVNYVVQEAIIVIKDIFRKYPNKYETTILTLCENLDTLDEPEAKASMIWIIGEYADRIENADELLDSFLDNFKDEPTQVQLQLLTATVKLFLKKPTHTQKMVQDVLGMATQDADNPDLRDRGYVYWRLLSTDPEAAKAVVLSEKPRIADDTSQLEPSLLQDLIANISTLASVYHKPPEAFVSRPRVSVPRAKPVADGGATAADDSDAYAVGESSGPAPETKGPQPGVLDLLDLGGPSPVTPVTQNNNNPDSLADLMGMGMGMGGGDTTGAAGGGSVVRNVTLPAAKGDGMQIASAFVGIGGQPCFDVEIHNMGQSPLTGFMIQFNKNSLGIKPAEKFNVNPPTINPGQKGHALLKCRQEEAVEGMWGAASIQIAVKNNVKVYFLTDQIPLHAALTADGQIQKDDFMTVWNQIPDSNEKGVMISNLSNDNSEVVKQKLKASSIFFVAGRAEQGKEILYFSAKTLTQQIMVLEMTLQSGSMCCQCNVRSMDVNVPPALFQSITTLLQN